MRGWKEWGNELSVEKFLQSGGAGEERMRYNGEKRKEVCSLEREDERRAAYQRARRDLGQAMDSFLGLEPVQQQQLVCEWILTMALRDGLNG